MIANLALYFASVSQLLQIDHVACPAGATGAVLILRRSVIILVIGTDTVDINIVHHRGHRDEARILSPRVGNQEGWASIPVCRGTISDARAEGSSKISAGGGGHG